jgi:hypothetical protein
MYIAMDCIMRYVFSKIYASVYLSKLAKIHASVLKVNCVRCKIGPNVTFNEQHSKSKCKEVKCIAMNSLLPS